MGYRDESETLKARIRELEARADRLRERVAENDAPLSKTKELVWEIELDGTLDEGAYEVMVSLLRRELDPNGKLQRIGSTLTYSIEPNQLQPIQRFITVTIESRRGKTRVRLVEKLHQMWNQNLVGFTVGLGWIGAIPLAGAAAALTPFLIPFGIVLPFVAMYAIAKRRFEKLARERRRELGAVMHELEEVARGHARTRVRVESDDQEAADEVEEELEPVALEQEA